MSELTSESSSTTLSDVITQPRLAASGEEDA
jgi:hypothetical protein